MRQSSPNFEKLKAHILLRSQATNFHTASKEWVVTNIELSDVPSHCPCGQLIMEHCHIANCVTGNETVIGNEIGRAHV